MMEYRLVRSKRKTLSLQISPEGELVVHAPKNCPKSYIDQFVTSKEGWIKAHQAKVQSALAERQRFRLREGDDLPFFGKSLTVHLAEEDRVRLDLEEGIITLPPLPVERLSGAVGTVYKKAGQPLLRQRLDHWAEKMGISYGKLTMSSAVRRWGSCSSDGNIHISWYLLMAPMDAIDYVLVHELSHRREFNHSPAFWAIVAQYIPDYKERKAALRQVQESLFSQGWTKK